MPQSSLENVFRYYCSVVVFWINLTIANSATAKQISSQMKSFSNSGAATATVIIIAGWVVGGLFYFFYRAIICDHVINHVLDCIFCKILRRENYRLWLQRVYRVGPRESENLFAVIRPHVEELKVGAVANRSALIHMGFQTGLICLAFSLHAYIAGQPGCWQLAFALFFLTITLVADVRIEDQVRMILQSSKNNFHEAAIAAIARGTS